MGISLISGDSTIEYGPSGKKPTVGNTYEYETLLYIIGLIKEQIRDEGLRVLGENCLELKLFGKNTNALIKENHRISGFPDMTIVSENFVICIDHFRTDASQPLSNNGKNHGSKYARILGKRGSDIKDEDLPLLVERINNEGVHFTRESLVANLLNTLTRKTAKIPRYIEAVKEHIKQKGEQAAEADLNKIFEVWFLVENTSPLIPGLGFPYSDPTIYRFLEKNKQIGGIINFDNPNPAVLISTLEAVTFIVNDDSAICTLKNWDCSKAQEH